MASSGSARYRRHLAEHASALASGEKLIPFAQDLAGCACEPTGAIAGVEVIPVGRARETDRCLRCGTTWKRRDWVGDQLVVLERGAA